MHFELCNYGGNMNSKEKLFSMQAVINQINYSRGWFVNLDKKGFFDDQKIIVQEGKVKHRIYKEGIFERIKEIEKLKVQSIPMNTILKKVVPVSVSNKFTISPARKIHSDTQLKGQYKYAVMLQIGLNLYISDKLERTLFKENYESFIEEKGREIKNVLIEANRGDLLEYLQFNSNPMSFDLDAFEEEIFEEDYLKDLREYIKTISPLKRSIIGDTIKFSLPKEYSYSRLFTEYPHSIIRYSISLDHSIDKIVLTYILTHFNIDKIPFTKPYKYLNYRILKEVNNELRRYPEIV